MLVEYLTTVTEEFILAISLFDFAELGWDTRSKGHQGLCAWLSSKLTGAQDSSNFNLKEKERKGNNSKARSRLK